jgi:hypothetical protein
LLMSFQLRNLIVIRPEHMAINRAEVGLALAPEPMQGKWIRPDETMR